MATSDPIEETRQATPAEMESSVARNLIPGALSVDALTTPVPEKIGKYPITRFLARGGMGNVYLGTHPNLGIPVAIKLIKNRNEAKSEYVERFIQEAHLASLLNHENIVRVYDADQDEGTYFMVQEYVEGGSVRDLLRTSPNHVLPLDDALRITVALARALTAAESLNIVHGDVKPANILLTRDSQPKLADLGLAREVDQQTTIGFDSPLFKTDGSVSGSPGYMSPEQISEPENMDTRSDVYALGVTFYQMLTGKLPFAGATVREMLHKHLNEDVGDPRKLNPEIPPRIAHIIMKMTARGPAERYQSAAALLTDLEGAAKPFWKRNIAALAALFFVLAVAAVTYVIPHPDDSRLALAEQHLCAGESAQAITVLEQIVSGSPGDIRALYALGLCHLEERDAASVELDQQKLMKLPDGEEFAQHLEALQAIDKGDLEMAERLVHEWEQKAKYRLPFLHTKGMLLLRRRNRADAKLALTAAVQEGALFDFQRFGVTDALARLFAAEGRPDKANVVYAQALKGRTGGLNLPPALQTNYAVSLMNAGKPGEAAGPLQIALQVDPQDEMALYLSRKLKRITEEAASGVTQRAMAMLDEVSKAVAADQGKVDAWSSRPIVLTFPPADNETPLPKRLGEEQRLTQKLVDEIQRRHVFPVVDRDAFDHILREQKVSASKLTAGDAHLRLGRLFPASVLVQATYREQEQEQARLRLRLVDVATSEIIAVLLSEQRADQDDAGFISAIADELLGQLHTAYPIQGKITSVSDDVCSIDVGRYHGLREGTILTAYPLEANPKAKALARRTPIARLRVQGLDKFTATARAEGTPKPELVEGMLVMAPTQ